MKTILMTLFICFSGRALLAAQFDGSVAEWKKNKEQFDKPEESFRKAFELLKDKYVDKNLTEGDLYRAATEGMLASLNAEKENKAAVPDDGFGKWNELLTPFGMSDMQIEHTGKLVGIGTTLSFDKATGNAKVVAVLPGSPALEAGIKKNDYVLSVDGKRYKGLREMVAEIRGKSGGKVSVKILRGDQLLDLKITRGPVVIPMFNSYVLSDHVGYLEIAGFSQDAASEVRKKLAAFADKKITKLILDLRGNSGGLFDSAIDVMDLFLQKGDTIGRARTRAGDEKIYQAKGVAWNPGAKIIVLTSPMTRCAAELMAASLKENRGATIIGGKTVGKWTVESVENLPNDYAIKYSVMLLESPKGKNYEGQGLSPDFEIAAVDASGDSNLEKEISLRVDKDPALKAAVEL